MVWFLPCNKAIREALEKLLRKEEAFTKQDEEDNVGLWICFLFAVVLFSTLKNAFPTLLL